MAVVYQSTVMQLVDGLTEEQMNNIVEQAKGIVALVECDGTEQYTD